MELVEVILQGVRGAQGVTRWAFPAGVAVVPAGPAEKLCARAAFELLGCISDGAIANAVEPGATGARAAVILIGRDQRRYRLVWDLASGRRALQVMNGDALEVISTVQAEIAQALTAQVGFPQQDTLREIYFSFPDDLPSRRVSSTPPTASSKGSADKPLPPGFGDAPSPSLSNASKPLPPGFDGAAGTSRFAGRPEEELRARLAELREKTSGVVDVQAIEFELDGLQKKTFELQGRKKPIATIDADIATVDDQIARYDYLRAYPDDFLERAQRLQQIEAEHTKMLASLDRESKGLVESVQHLSDEVSGVTKRGRARPLDAAVNDPLVKFGVLGGVAAILIAFIGGMAEDALRWVAFLNIPAFAVAVYGGVQLLNGLEEGASTRMKLTRIAMQRRAAVERFEIDKEQIARLLEKNQLVFAQLPELISAFMVRAEMLARRGKLAHEREGLLAGGLDATIIDAELSDITVRIKQLEQALSDAGSRYDPDVGDAQREADEIERVLRGELKAEAAPEPAPSVAVVETPESAAPAEHGVDVARLLIRLASDLVVQSVDATASALAPRAGQMMQALTDGRCTAMSLTSGGVDITVGGAATRFSALPAADRDMVALAIRLAIVEAATKTAGRLPLMFDRVFDGLPAERAPLIVRALQFIGQSTQVMIFTAKRELAAAGTVVQAAVAAPQAPT